MLAKVCRMSLMRTAVLHAVTGLHPHTSPLSIPGVLLNLFGKPCTSTDRQPRPLDVSDRLLAIIAREHPVTLSPVLHVHQEVDSRG